MKSLFLSFIILFAWFTLFAQQKPLVKPHPAQAAVRPIRPAVMLPHVYANTGTLSTGEFNSFDYESNVRRNDSLILVNHVNRFKQRLVTIDSLLANNQFQLLNETRELEFTVQYAADASIDTITIVLHQTNRFNEEDYFESIVQESNLTSLQNAIKRAQYVQRLIEQRFPLQVEPISRQLSDMQYKSGNDNSAYANALLTFIHELLKDNKAKLGITDDTIYETSFEPGGLDDNKKIAMREKFVRYIYSKI